ncbi:MAG: hypothetical protein AAFZ38_00390 [Myxococcota bacterium]
MAIEDYDVSEQLTNIQARKLMSFILNTGGSVVFRRHALEELRKDGCSEADARNVLRNGWLEPNEVGELRNETWRYRFHTHRMCVVVAFDTVTRCIVVTAWEKKRS